MDVKDFVDMITDEEEIPKSVIAELKLLTSL